MLAVILLFSSWLMYSTFGYQDNSLVLASRLWSDFAAHVPLVRSFSLGDNFPPEYPQFAGMKIRYHYLFYLLAAGLEVLGLNIAQAVNLLSAAGLVLMLWMIYQLGKLLSQKQPPARQRAVGILALVLVLFNSSLTFVDFFKSCTGVFNCFWQLVGLKDFVNFGPWGGDVVSAFWNWNIFTNQRHLGLSFGLVLAVVWPLVKSVYTDEFELNLKYWLWIIWGGLILLPFFNQAAYVMSVIFILVWLGLNPKLLKPFANLYFLGLLYSLPSFAYFLGFSSIEFEPGFLAKNDSIFAIVNYLWHNIGFYCLLLQAVVFYASSKDRKLLAVAGSYFVLANTFRLSPDMINNHKLINLVIIVLALVSAKVLIKWAWKAGFLQKAAVGLVIAVLTLSGLIDAFPIINDRTGRIADYQQTELGRWIVNNTEQDVVFLTTSRLYHPANLAGRKTFLDYGYFAWSLGYPDRERRKVLPQIFTSQTEKETWCQVVSGLGIDYLSVIPSEEIQGDELGQSWLVKNQTPIFSNSQQLIFSVSRVCQ